MGRPPRTQTIGVLVLPAVFAACNGLDPADRARLETFDTYWSALHDAYPYFGRKAIDWNELGQQYRSAVPVVERSIDFYHVLAGMLCELQDNHVALEVPDALLATDGVLPTRLDRREGFALTIIGGRLFVTGWPEGEAPTPPAHLPAEQRALPELVKVEGYPAVRSLLHVLFTGPPSSPTELLLRWKDGTLTHHAVTRPATRTPPRRHGDTGQVVTIVRTEPVEFEPRAGHGYLRVRSFGTADIEAFRANADAAVDQAIAHGDRLVIDLRGNGGGQLAAATLLAGRLVATPVVLIQDTKDEHAWFGLVTWRRFTRIVADPRPPQYPGAVAVLIDGTTASAAEHFARILQLRGAVLVGEPTAGLEASVRKIDGPDGSTLTFGADSLLDERGRRFQGEGVQADIALPLQRDEVRMMGVEAARRAWEARLLEAAAQALAARKP
jgi:carboxyl-terminal processing protease